MARYNLYATIENISQSTLVEDTSHMKHGEMVVAPPGRIEGDGHEGTFSAKSKGWTIEGTVTYHLVDTAGKLILYFHNYYDPGKVHAVTKAHAEEIPAGYDIGVSMVDGNSYHPYVTFKLTKK